MSQSFWQREKHRVLGAMIIGAVVLLLLAIIWRQQGEVERLEESLESCQKRAAGE